MTVCIYEQRQHLIRTHLSVLVLQRGTTRSTEKMCAHILALGNIVWSPDLPIAMWETPIAKGRCDVNFLASRRKALLYILSLVSKR